MNSVGYRKMQLMSLWWMIAIVAACQVEDTRTLTTTGERVMVNLNLGISTPINAMTAETRNLDAAASVTADSKSAFTVSFTQEPAALSRAASNASFYNLWAFQFDNAGNIVGSPQQLSGAQTPIKEKSNLSVSLTVGQDQTIYLVAAGKKITADLSGIRMLQELKDFKFDYIVSEKGGYTSSIEQPEDIPYVGYISGTNIISLGQGAGMLEYNSPDGFSGSIGMKELVAKVTLRYKYEVETHILQGVRLQNVNSHIAIGNPTSYTPSEGVEFHLLNLKAIGVPDASGYYTVSWYVAQNLQGTIPEITSEIDRYYKEGVGYAPQYGLCLEVLGKNITTPTEFSLHRIFVGKNNTTNFDVEANHHYTLTTEFNTGYIGGATTDPRLELSEFTSPKIEFFSSRYLTQGGLGVDNGGEKYDLDAHYDTRPVVVETSGSSVELGIYSDEACQQLVDPSQSWLQISIEPNYTLAVNNSTSPLTNYLSVEARVPSKLRFYLYNDEYVKVNTDNTSLKRSLYLKVTIKELDVSRPKTTIDRFKIDQRPIFICGQFGAYDKGSSEYTSLLGIDRISEYQNSYVLPEAPIVTGLIAGYFNFEISNSVLLDMNYGLPPTILLATNPYSWSSAKGEVPRKIGGKIDLYQYSYYDAFAARYCYDMNRDLDGNGILENPNSRGENEIKWYLPSGSQALSMFIDGSEKVNTLTTYVSRANTAGYATDNGVLASNAGRSSISPVRCVRDIELPSSFKSTSPKVEVLSLKNTGQGETGSASYAVIDASLMPGTVIRTDENIYDEVPLYQFKVDGGGDAEMENGIQKKVYRVKRHSKNSSVDVFISKKFAIAPQNIDGDGNSNSNAFVTWAHAGGWDALANSKGPLDAESFRAVEQGCPMYRGRDGKDAPGTWRLPTKKEISLMLIYSQKLYSTYDKTGFVRLLGSYCAATESIEQCDAIYNMICIGTLGKRNEYPKFYVRCIRDIP